MKHNDIVIEKEFYFQWHITEKCNLRCFLCQLQTFVSKEVL